jgi:uncharacterized membrane protein YfcA
VCTELLVQGHAVSLPGVVVLGIAVGIVAGLFGVGGGFLLTPLLNVVFGVPLPIAVGTGLSLIVGTSLPALLRHRAEGQGELRFDLLMLPGSLLGVEAGARTLDVLSELGAVSIAGRTFPAAAFVVQSGYVLLLGTAAAVFWRQGRRESTDRPGPPTRGPLARWSFPPRIDLPTVQIAGVATLPIAYLGLGLGFLAGLLGIGGGVALMPIMVYGYGFPLRQAAGTGILVLFVSASVGTFLHALRGHVHLGLVAALLVGASLSAQAGVLATRRLSVTTLRRLFAAVLVAAAAAVVWNLLRSMELGPSVSVFLPASAWLVHAQAAPHPG